jgi:hypothetical protein
MTVVTEIKAITFTPTAKAALSKSGTDIASLTNQALLATYELKKCLSQIVSLHPTGGGDAANLSALNAVIAELA